MDQRIKAFQTHTINRDAKNGFPLAVALVGNPGIVRLGRSPAEFTLINVTRRSVYLWRRVAHFLRVGQPVLRFQRDTLFVFTCRGVFKDPRVALRDIYQYMQCHVDLDVDALPKCGFPFTLLSSSYKWLRPNPRAWRGSEKENLMRPSCLTFHRRMNFSMRECHSFKPLTVSSFV
jgi:hypothetical protein